MLKPLLVIFLAMGTACSINPAALGQVEKRERDDHLVLEEVKCDRKNMTRISVKNNTKMDRAVKRRYRRNVSGQQDPSYLCDDVGNEDYPVVVVIGDSGVGKSSLLNYIGNFGVGHQCYFESGEADLGSGVTSETVAKKLLYRGNPNLNFIGVDTPGLSDVRGKGKDKQIMKDIATFLENNLSGRKIALFLYVYQGSKTRYDFHSLKVYNAMFGPSFFSHLAVEVTFWYHDPASRRTRKKNRKLNEEVLTKKLRDELVKVTKIEQNVADNVPVVFVDPTYDISTYVDYSQSTIDKISQLQTEQVENLRREIFDGLREGIICDADCQDATNRVIQILDNDFNPIIREGDQLTIYQGTSLKLTCIVPIMEQYCSCFKASWYRNDNLIEEGEFVVSEEEDDSGVYKRIELSHEYTTTLESGEYQCKASTCKLGENDKCENPEKESKKIQVTVNSLPPEISFNNINEISCIQEYPNRKYVQVSFRVFRKDIVSQKEYLVTYHFMENKPIELGTKIEKKFYKRIDNDILPGEYFCQTQFGESEKLRSENPDVNGGWTSWGTFDQCTVTCGGGTRKRSRYCTAPVKLNNGKKCEGPNEQILHCNPHSCKENIELVQAVDGSQNIPLYFELEPMDWCCNSKTKICQIVLRGGNCAALDQNIENGCFGKKCRNAIGSTNIKTALGEINMDIQNDCLTINIIGVHINLNILEKEIYKCRIIKKIYNKLTINIKADSIIASKSITITGAEIVKITARMIIFDSDTNLEIIFDQNGADGKVGKTGENGAHVYIISHYIVTRKLTKIVVKGGHGGEGQDGAEGAKGTRGKPDSNTRFYNEEWDKSRNSYYNVPTNRDMSSGKTTGNCLKYEVTDKRWFEFQKIEGCRSGFSPNRGVTGTSGGSGGQGGAGGAGGSSGFIKIEASEKVYGEIITQKIGGTGGPGGAGGKGGEGGVGGEGELGVSGIQVENQISEKMGNCYSHRATTLRVNKGCMGANWCAPSTVYVCVHVEVRGYEGKPGPKGSDGSKGQKGKTGTIDVEIDLAEKIMSSQLSKMLEKRSLQYLLLTENTADDLLFYMFYNEKDIRNNIGNKLITNNVGSKGSTGTKTLLDRNLISLQATTALTVNAKKAKLNEIKPETMTAFNTMENEMLTHKKNQIKKDMSQKRNRISFLQRKQSALLGSLPHKVMSALNSKPSSIRDQERANKVASNLKMKLDLLSLATGVLSGGASIISERGSIATIIVESEKLKTSQGGQVGCQENMLDDVIKIMTKHKNAADALQEKISKGEEIGNEIDKLMEILIEDFKKYKRFELSNLIERSLYCVLDQNINYQKEQSAEAKHLKNKIKEYITANKLRLSLLEKWNEKKQELVLVQNQLDSPVPYTSDMFADNKEALMVLYSNQEYQTLKWIQDYVAALEYEYLKCFEDTAKIKNTVKLPLSLPMSRNYESLNKQTLDLNKNVEAAKRTLKKPLFDEFYTIITNENVLKELETTFQTKVTLKDLPERSVIVKGKQIADHTNIRIRKIFVNIEFTNTANIPDTNPDQIYVEVRQDPITSFDVSGYSLMTQDCRIRDDSSDRVSFQNEFEMKSISKFEPKSSTSIEDQIKSHFDNPNTDLCLSDDNVCFGLHSSYYINVPSDGGPSELLCPNKYAERNCKGLQLNHLKALHVAVRYSYRDPK